MAQSRSSHGLPDPNRITTKEQLAAALKAVKGHLSYHDLAEGADALVPTLSARRSGAGGQDWIPELLTRGSVSDWLHGRGLPTRNKLLTFLTVCGIRVDQFDAWCRAVDRAKHAAPGRTITEYEPIRQLGVHPAIHGAPERADEPRDLDVLTPYVMRNHDHHLREVLRTGRGNQLVVLVGGSSVGKTRACYEAVREVLPGWPVVHPATVDELLALLGDQVLPRTVLWLNETQRYLRGPRGAAVAVALQRMLDTTPPNDGADRVLALGSMWLNPYWHDFTRPPEPKEPDKY